MTCFQNFDVDKANIQPALLSEKDPKGFYWFTILSVFAKNIRWKFGKMIYHVIMIFFAHLINDQFRFYGSGPQTQASDIEIFQFVSAISGHTIDLEYTNQTKLHITGKNAIIHIFKLTAAFPTPYGTLNKYFRPPNDEILTIKPDLCLTIIRAARTEQIDSLAIIDENAKRGANRCKKNRLQKKDNLHTSLAVSSNDGRSESGSCGLLRPELKVKLHILPFVSNRQNIVHGSEHHICNTILYPSDKFLSCSRTVAPAAPNCRAIPRPIPREAPVTTAIFPAYGIAAAPEWRSADRTNYNAKARQATKNLDLTMDKKF
uniref:Uncharacterized protein n=1 Tax=Romanomermis culicivorax TaxID=13658 RepID=A0A915JEN7_ROMCU